MGLHGIADQNREDLKFPAFVPTTHTLLAEVESAVRTEGREPADLTMTEWKQLLG